MHQLPPIMGQSVYTPIDVIKNAKDRYGRLLWTGEKWNKRQSLSVLMKHQYRMQEPLASISERFANGTQTVEDAILLSEKVLKEGVEDWELHFRDGLVGTRVLCSDNNSKAALNWEIVKWLHQNEWYSWEAQSDNRNLEVVDQLEPMQCAWKWMPVICLENYLGTDVVNGALCWIVSIVLKEDDTDTMPHCVFVVAAEAQDAAKAKINGKNLRRLIQDKVVVPVMAVKREGRKAIPLAPVWCMTLHKVQGMTLDRVVLNLSSQLSAPLLYTAMTRVHAFDKLWLLQKLSPSLFLTMKFSPHIKAEIKRLKQQEKKTRDYLQDQVTKWTDLVPALLDMTWMNEFGNEEQEENIMNNSIQAQEEYISIRTNLAVCIPVKSLELFEEYNDWISACTMLCCPAILLLKAKEEEMMKFLEFKFDTDDWSQSQINQIKRTALVVNLRIAMKKMEVGTLLEKEWLYIEKREKENEWKKLFKGKDKTCMKMLKGVVHKRTREDKEVEEME